VEVILDYSVLSCFLLEGYVELKESVLQGSVAITRGVVNRLACSASKLYFSGELIDGTALTAGIWWGRIRPPRLILAPEMVGFGLLALAGRWRIGA